MIRWLPLLVVLWLTSSLFLGGDLGKWADDYFFAGRDPSTGAVTAVPSLASRPFRRPLTWLLVTRLSQRFWFDDTILHLLNALAHALTATMLALLLRALGLSVPAVAAAVGLFLVYPAHYEVVFWSSALSTGLAAAAYLVVCYLTVRRARHAPSRISLVGIALLSFAIPCLNEQPAAGLLALPLLHASAAPAGASRPAFGLFGEAVAASVGSAIYGILFWSTTLPGMRGTVSMLPALGDLGAEVARLAREALAQLALLDFARGAFALGGEAVARAPGRAAMAGALAAAAFWFAARREGRRTRAEPSCTSRQRFLLLGFGLAVFLLDWVPLLAARGTTAASRVMYAPSLGLAIVVATLLDFLEGALSRRAIPARVGHAALAVLLVAGMVLGCVAMIGIQAAFQARSRDDRALAAALKQAAPDPAPGAMLLVLEDARAAVRTGARRFDGALLSPLSLQGSATPYIRWMYGRNDLHAAQITSWAPPTVAEVAADGVALLGLEPAFPMGIEPRSDGAVLVPWSRLLTLCIDPKGGVHLAREGPLRCGTVGRGPS